MAEAALHPATVIEQFKKNGVTHVVWLPDSETNFLYRLMLEEKDSFELITVSREAETIAIAAGLWVGGKKPAVLIQNTGLMESGDSIRALGVDSGLPVVILVGYRGWTRHGVTTDSAARLTEPTLHAWGLNYYLVETDADGDRISFAFEEAQRTSRPVAVLMGAEYAVVETPSPNRANRAR